MAKTEGRFARFRGEMRGLGNTMAGFGRGLQGTAMGRAASEGTMEALGWAYENQKVINAFGREEVRSVSQGFLGLKGMRAGTMNWGMSPMTGVGAKQGAKNLASNSFRIAGRMMPAFFTLYSAVEGYNEGGMMGAISGVAQSVAMNAALKMLPVAGTAAVPLAIAAAAGYAGYKFADAARDYGRNLKKVNMGAPVVDTFGTIATTRQRSLQALQNTHINGRMALGNEGLLIHTNIYSR